MQGKSTPWRMAKTSTMTSKGEQFIDRLETMLKANMAVWVTTQEEERLIKSLRGLVPKFKSEGPDFQVLIWSATEKLVNYTPFLRANAKGDYNKPLTFVTEVEVKEKYTSETERRMVQIGTIDEVVSLAKQSEKPTLWVIKDIHHVLDHRKGDYYLQIRRLRDLVQALRNRNSWLVMIAPDSDVPEDLQKEISVVDMPLPDAIEIGVLLDSALADFKKLKVKTDVSPALRDKIIFNLLGLSEVEISQVLTYTCVNNRGISESALRDIKDAKRQIIERGGYLEFIEQSTPVEVGGHDVFKEYVEERGLYLDKQYREHFNLKAPKGVCLVGPPGSGKSLFARYISYQWSVPLMRIDMGAIYGEKLGQSEGRLRNALRIVEANAPCILWIDELEKAIGGINTSDSGTTLRIFGKLLTWMAERKEMVFLYCTSNNLEAIPAEFKRAGRLDTIWWAELPTEQECQNIIHIHCKANKIAIDDKAAARLAVWAFDMQMTGAEIEHAVLDSCYKAATQSKKERREVPIDATIILSAMKRVRTYAVNNKGVLAKDRLHALDKFEFTSEESLKNVQKLKGDLEAIRKEFSG